jgi:hypothetical protein
MTNYNYNTNSRDIARKLILSCSKAYFKALSEALSEEIKKEKEATSYKKEVAND